MPRMRTINEAYKQLKETDPQTAITPYHLRQMILNDKIPYIKAGKKYLVNFDVLIKYLEDGVF